MSRDEARAGGVRTRSGTARGRVLRTAQGAAAVYLLAQALVSDSPSLAVEVTHAAAGALLVLVTLTAAVSRRVRRWEGPVCLLVGAGLISAAAVLGFGPGVEAAAQQWSQVVVGVLLVGLWSARTG